MTAIMPETQSPNPRLQRLAQYAAILQEFVPGQHSSQDANIADPDIRDLMRLTRLAYKQESDELALERAEQTRKERRELSVGPVAAAAIGGIEGSSALLGAIGGAKAGAVVGAPFG